LAQYQAASSVAGSSSISWPNPVVFDQQAERTVRVAFVEVAEQRRQSRDSHHDVKMQRSALLDLGSTGVLNVAVPAAKVLEQPIEQLPGARDAGW
jgi:hypothetical protein